MSHVSYSCAAENVDVLLQFTHLCTLIRIRGCMKPNRQFVKLYVSGSRGWRNCIWQEIDITFY